MNDTFEKSKEEDSFCSSIEVNAEKVKSSKTKDETHSLDNDEQQHSTSHPYKCHSCSVSFIHKRYLQRHIKNVHEKISKISCDLCDKTFSIKNSLAYHKFSHHKGPEPAWLKKHQLSKLEPETLYECSECVLKFTRPLSLQTHIKKYHNKKNQPYQCTECPLSFAKDRYLWNHMKNMHVQKKKHQCDVRKFMFFLKYEMFNIIIYTYIVSEM